MYFNEVSLLQSGPSRGNFRDFLRDAGLADLVEYERQIVRHIRCRVSRVPHRHHPG